MYAQTHGHIFFHFKLAYSKFAIDLLTTQTKTQIQIHRKIKNPSLIHS